MCLVKNTLQIDVIKWLKIYCVRLCLGVHLNMIMLLNPRRLTEDKPFAPSEN